MSKKLNSGWKGVAHSRIPHDVTDGPGWRVLSFSAKALYIDMRAKLRSTNNGNINATLSEMKHRGWTSSATLSKSLRQLEHMGFIAKTRQGGIAFMSKRCSLYRFTDLPVFEHPKQKIMDFKSTFEYRRFESVSEAKSTICELTERKKTKVQKLKLTALESEAMTPFIASETEQESGAQLQNLNKEKTPESSATPGYSPK